MAVHLPEPVYTDHLQNKDFGYQYTNGLDLRPGSAIHERIKSECLSLAMQSQSVMQQRHAAWDAMAQKLTAFISTDLAQALEKRLDPRKPASVVVPVSYANYETTLAYLMNALLIDPIFRYEQTEPNDRVKVALLELLISYQNRKSRAFLELYAALQDCLRYGIGIIHCRWEVWMGQKTQMRDKLKPSNVLPGQMYIDKPAGLIETYKAFEGNVFEAIDPYLYYPDTSVPLYQPHKGEYAGWLSPGNNRLKLQELERTSEGYMFNVKYLQYIDNRSHLHVTTARTYKVGAIDINTSGATAARRPIDILWMYRDIIPAEQGLGPSEELEKWVFGIANDAIVIAAAPTGLDHKRCPLVVLAPEADGHTIMPVARLELSYGLQEVADFEFNSHIASVMKILRDNLIIDPGLLNLETLKDGSMFRHLFLKRSVWGLGKIDQAVKQLEVYDPTVNNLRDVQTIHQLSGLALGTNEAGQGLRRQGGERVTATEIQDVRSGSSSRLNKVAAVLYAQAFMDLADIQASHTRQLMTDEIYTRVTGRYRQDLMREFNLQGEEASVLITPDMIDADWDTAASDVFTSGTSNVNDWRELYQMLLQNPQAAGKIDLTRVFLHIARLLGERNAADFLLNPNVQVQSDQQVAKDVQAGNLVPANGVLQ